MRQEHGTEASHLKENRSRGMESRQHPGPDTSPKSIPQVGLISYIRPSSHDTIQLPMHQGMNPLIGLELSESNRFPSPKPIG